MIAEISSKIAAFAIALTMNAMIIAAVSYAFDAQMSADSGQRAPCACTPHSDDCRCGVAKRRHESPDPAAPVALSRGAAVRL
jgi:hypothetical protein